MGETFDETKRESNEDRQTDDAAAGDFEIPKIDLPSDKVSDKTPPGNAPCDIDAPTQANYVATCTCYSFVQV